MNIKNAIMLLEHTSHEDEIIARSQAIKCLVNELKKKDEVINKATNLIKLYGKYNGEKCTRGFNMMTADFNKLLQILEDKEVE